LKKSEFDSPVVLAHPHVLEEKSVVVQHATPAIEEALVCIKSYGDTGILMPEISVTYKRITTLQIYLNGGEMITAFKTLKHFEGVLSYPL
jgi:hypothetical protein